MAGLSLRSLTVSHFRSHKAACLELDGRPVVIYGANGAGKTNLLEAVSLLSPGRGMRRAASDDIARRPERLGWKVSAVLDRLGQQYEIETRAAPGAARQVRIDGKAATQSALGRLVQVVWLIPAMDRLWIEGAEGRRRFLDRLVLSFEPGHGDAALSYEKSMRERNRMLKDQVRDPHWYNAVEDQMARAGALMIASRARVLERLRLAQQGAQTAFPAAGLCIEAPEEGNDPQGVDELRSAWMEGRSRDLAAGRTLVGPHRIDLAATYEAKGVEARHCSTGEQKALLISLILANGRALAQDRGTPPVLLLDEVAAHLDAERRTALYDEICALGAQAFMTGTEDSLFAALGPRAGRIHVSENGGLSSLG
ncbi:DNA replication/repair protein RecF [Candidatus Halocynthiibacter alkanivorans]|uniref:DNA replication/repair protein RecF n=1 Tax=Candidatus Halocynthiibacter alkanivorans TaxID=2267619 RepID=UPI000DF4B85A|nr:DNA replication/repair protein RecF [Candidatus Halocynthiibacter alkanivorans]